MTKSRPLFDEFWEEKRIRPENIQDLPMYLTASYSTGLHCEGSFESFEVAQTSRKWLRVHATQEWHDIYRLEATDDLQRFYDYYAKGIENGWEAETPRVRLTLLGYDGSVAKNVVERPEEQWPPARQQVRRYYLDTETQTMKSTNPTGTASATHEGHSLTASSVRTSARPAMTPINSAVFMGRILRYTLISILSFADVPSSNYTCPATPKMILTLWCRYARSPHLENSWRH
jgi:predicted acyl esterase